MCEASLVPPKQSVHEVMNLLQFRSWAWATLMYYETSGARQYQLKVVVQACT